MPHPPMPETAFEVNTVEKVLNLRRRLVDAGYGRIEVAGCVDMVMAKAAGEDLALVPSTASRYRKMLKRLLSEEGRPWPPPRARGNGQPVPEVPAVAERGAAAVEALKTVAIAAAIAALLGWAPIIHVM